MTIDFNAAPDKIRAIRHGLHMSRRQFARALGWHGKNAADNVGKVETGKKTATPAMVRTLKDLAQRAGVIAVILTAIASPARAERGPVGTIKICRSHEGVQHYAFIPKGSVFVQIYTADIFGGMPGTVAKEVKGGAEIETLNEVMIDKPEGCAIVFGRVMKHSSNRDEPKLKVGTSLAPEFTENFTNSDLRATITDGFDYPTPSLIPSN